MSKFTYVVYRNVYRKYYIASDEYQFTGRKRFIPVLDCKLDKVGSEEAYKFELESPKLKIGEVVRFPDRDRNYVIKSMGRNLNNEIVLDVSMEDRIVEDKVTEDSKKSALEIIKMAEMYLQQQEQEKKDQTKQCQQSHKNFMRKLGEKIFGHGD